MNTRELILIKVFCHYHGIEVIFFSKLQDYGLIEILSVENNDYFLLKELAKIEKIIKLHFELEINLEGIDVIIQLLNQIDDYKNQIRSNQNRLDFFEK